jgi:hypothetical protein
MRRARARQAMPAVRMPPVDYGITTLGPTIKSFQTYPGGLDLVTPTLELQPGALRAAQNFECGVRGGYARIDGYERYDGHPSPSAAGYTIVQVASFTNTPNVNDVVTQTTSGATGTVAAVNTSPPYMVVTKITGTFDFTHSISNQIPLVIGTAVTTTATTTGLQQAVYTAAAADVYRANISAVPGSGSVLGVFYLHLLGSDGVYAFRANAGGTAVLLYKATASGWTVVPFFNLVSFTAGSGGTGGPLDGTTLTQGGVTATVQRVMWQSGAWSGSAVGQFVVTNPSGGNFAAGAATVTGGFTVTLSGIQTAITMSPGGRFEIVDGNFTGMVTTDRAYGCDGVNKGWEFDGTTLAPITTGVTAPFSDKPLHVAVHKGYLMFSYGSTFLYCGAGTPFKWSAIDGGGEIAVGDNIQAMLSLPGNQSTATLAIFQTSNTSFLYGTSATTWQLVTYVTSIGARAYSVQNLFDMFSFDDFGVMTLQATLNFGNFSSSTLTRNILPFLIPERSSVVASNISRTKSQYRVFFRDGYGLYVTVVNGTYIGSIPILFPNPVTCTYNDKTASGDEVNFFGSTNGFVYQLDKGTGFDGQNLFAYMTTAWDPLKSPRVRKRFRAISMEISSTGFTSFTFAYSLGYSSALINQPSPVSTMTPFSVAPTWDQFIWDQFTWDGLGIAPSDLDMTGTAENVQTTIQSSTNYIPAYQVNSIIYHYTPRRGIRV